MNKEELLEYAKKHYPIGTQYVPVHVDMGINEVVDTDYNYGGGSTEYIRVKSKHIENSFNGCIYKDGEWAKIVSQFEVGKWYKSNRNAYGKFLRIGNASNWYFITSERITSSGYSKDEYGFNNDKKWELLTDLSEIQDYLPEGHPDKIVKPKALVGRYLKCLKTNSWGSGKTAIGEYLKIIDADNYGDFLINNTNTWFSRNRIKNGEYELMPEGFDPKNEIAKQEIPEYVECIPSKLSQSYAIIGRIYKFVKVSEEHWGVECNLDCDPYNPGTTLYFYPEQFKPSTKKAYEAQQKKLEYPLTEKEALKKKWIPKVGDWVVIIETDAKKLGFNYSGNNSNTYNKGDVVQLTRNAGRWYNGKNPELNYNWWYTSKDYSNGIVDVLFRKAEPHEIPKENLKPLVSIPAYMVDGVCTISPPEIEPEIDSWCIQLTEENKDLLLQNKHVFKADWSFDNLKHYYGITKFNVPSYYSGVTHFGKVLTTEEFCKKFNITESYKWVEIDFSKPIENMTLPELTSVYEFLKDEKNQQSKINKVKVELIPVKKLIKN